MASGDWAPGGSWDDSEPEEGGDYEDKGTRRFWMPVGKTKRVLFTTGVPQTLWEHSMYDFTRDSKHKEVCLKKNKIDPDCEPCVRDAWPYFVGYFGVIDMGDVVELDDGEIELQGWTNDKGTTYQFGKKMYGAKRGSKKKPSILPKLDRKRKRLKNMPEGWDGTLRGCVFDVTRTGDLEPNVGNEFEFVEYIAPADWKDYLLDLGADAERLDLDPIKWREEIVPKTSERLRRICAGSGGSSGGGGGRVKRAEGNGGGSNDNSGSGGSRHDDVPF